MKYNILILLIISFLTFGISYIQILYTESFILFLAFFTIFIYAVSKKSYKIGYSKENIKWNEIILFYTAIKNWNRFIIRDRSVKILNFLNLAIAIKKYETIWLKKNITKLEERDIIYLHTITIKRLEILKSYKKLNTRSNPLNYFNI